MWCLFKCSSTCDIPLEQKRHPSASALVFQDVGHAIGWQSLQCTWALCISAAKNSHHHSWQLSKILHLPFCFPKFWSLYSNMKVSLTLTSSTSVLFGRTCQDNLRFCFVTHLDVFRELNLYLKIWGVQTVQKFTVPAIKWQYEVHVWLPLSRQHPFVTAPSFTILEISYLAPQVERDAAHLKAIVNLETGKGWERNMKRERKSERKKTTLRWTRLAAEKHQGFLAERCSNTFGVFLW